MMVTIDGTLRSTGEWTDNLITFKVSFTRTLMLAVGYSDGRRHYLTLAPIGDVASYAKHRHG
jgi:hypothetical protein